MKPQPTKGRHKIAAAVQRGARTLETNPAWSRAWENDGLAERDPGGAAMHITDSSTGRAR